MSLLQELANGLPKNVVNLKKSDGSDAGKNDIKQKIKPNDVSFSLMRNTINADGEVTGSDVADYLERAAELNDEVETVPFGIETDDGQIVKVYVNAEEAAKFEEAMKKLLGVEDDVEDAINKLALEFDIVDVVWPKDSEEGVEGEQSSFDPLDDDGEEMEEVASFDPLEEQTLAERSMPINDGNSDDSKEPTPDELAAFRKLNEIVEKLGAMGSAGVQVATGYDRDKFTKHEMITKYVKEKYSKEADVVRTWMNRVADDALPYWLK